MHCSCAASSYQKPDRGCNACASMCRAPTADVAAGFSTAELLDLKYCWHYNYNIQATAHYSMRTMQTALAVYSRTSMQLCHGLDGCMQLLMPALSELSCGTCCHAGTKAATKQTPPHTRCLPKQVEDFGLKSGSGRQLATLHPLTAAPHTQLRCCRASTLWSSRSSRFRGCQAHW